MSDHEHPDPLDAETADLLARAPGHADLPPDVPARLFGRVAATAGFVPPGGSSPGGQHGGGGSTAALSSGAKGIVSRLFPFALGVASGVGGHIAYQHLHPAAH